MKNLMLIATVAAFVVPTAAFAQSGDSAIKNNPGYQSGSSNSGQSGMDSSRGVPTSPTAAQPGTVDNGSPGGAARGTAGQPH